MKLRAQEYAIVGDGQAWRWFSDPVDRIQAKADFSDAVDRIQQARQSGPVTFAIDYEASVALAYPELPQSGCIDAIRWGSMETLSLSQVLSRLPEPATDWHWSLELEPQQWAEKIARLRAYLEAGDCYQGNLTIRGQGQCAQGAAQLWHALMLRQPVPYAALMPWNGGSAISLSPELLWHVQGDQIHCQPMKGTVGLGDTQAEAHELAQWLAADPKNRAENLMILDLIRNDLGRIAAPGSVSVPESFQVRQFQTLQQMVSTVRAQLTEHNFGAWVRALMPYGSITGAPKKRSVQVLAELEDSPRGLYTGSCGFVTPDESVANVAIRTATLSDQVLKFGVGGGITVDSDAAEEWAEVLLKTRFIQPATGF